jgi:hypothetical protein
MVQTRRQRIENGDECPPIRYFENERNASNRSPNMMWKPFFYNMIKGVFLVGVFAGLVYMDCIVVPTTIV